MQTIEHVAETIQRARDNKNKDAFLIGAGYSIATGIPTTIDTK
jgi:hypothetical protein